MTTFTVAVTVFGGEHFLPHALETVFAQAHPTLEVVVYSDGPSPSAAEIVRGLPADLPVGYRALDRRPGLHGNHLRRQALEDARGTHVCFLGHDCLLYPTYLEAHAEALAGDDEGVSVVPVAYWRQTRRDAGQPRRSDMLGLGEGEIDLLCIAFPRAAALAADCFGPAMQPWRCADYLSFDRLRRRSAPRFVPGPDRAAHF